MTKFVKYTLSWIGAVILFNLICFLAPIRQKSFDGSSSGFWTAYGFVMVAFVFHLIFSFVALDEKKTEKRIANIPLFYIVTLELLTMIVAGLICMAVPTIPNWLRIIICYALLFFFVICFFIAKTVGDTTQAANIDINRKTFSFRVLTDKAQELVSMADTAEKKQIAQSVYEKLRYSDMVSDPRLASIESDIFSKINKLTTEFQNGTDIQIIQKTANDLMFTVDQRSNKCKTLKRQV